MGETTVRLKRGKKTFEVLVNDELLPQFRAGKLRATDVVATPSVFTNMSKGTKASKDDLQTAFKTADADTILTEVLQKGDIPKTATDRKEIADSRRQQVITHLTKSYVGMDGLPIPAARFENALTEIRARIDQRPPDKQADLLMERLKGVLAMKRRAAGMEAVITLPAAMAGTAASTVRKHAVVQRVVYAEAVKFEVEVLAYDALLKDLARISDNEFEFSVVSPTQPPAADAQAAPPPARNAAKGKKKKKKNSAKLDK